jgi:hypothetical protein
VKLGSHGLTAAAVQYGTWSLLPPGIPERVAVYPFEVWQMVAGVVLVRRHAPSGR